MSPSKLSRVQQTAARQEKKQKRKVQEGKLHVKRQEMDKAKVRVQFRFLPLLPF
jgi:SWI/SNF-related matrix-associated actin-dependent regulator of chromatin subfamily A member 5